MIATRTRPLLLACLAACGSSSAPTRPAAPPRPVAPAPVAEAEPPRELEPPDLRLPTVAKPLRNTVDLTIDPRREDFSGRITTELELGAATDVLWLHADELTIERATLTVGGERLTARAELHDEFLGLALPRAVGPGPATLEIVYRGAMHKNDGDGIYTAQEAGDWYAFTQFEATDARQAFPCFDEPSFKVPWQLTLHTPEDLMALSNTPVEAEHAEANGMKATAFAATHPLPSYLVAFAVGPFDTVDAGTTRGGAPIRIVVPRGRGGDAGYPVEATRPILDRLEDYFGIPYPYPKLDVVAVSVFNAGAMENPGLITYRQEIILTKPAEMTLAARQRYAGIAAHEMAHQWFGDYVTMAWWDDTWLNESFASWMATKIVDGWQPDWDVGVRRVAQKGRVMRGDGLASARAIRQPIETPDDIANAFDGITYGKGEAVLTMFESWLGPDVFQAGVRAYLAQHAFGNATYDDFVNAMSQAAGKDLHPQFESFVKQSGLPLVTVALACTKGEAPTLQLAQRRYAPTGSKIDPDRAWSTPVCVRWGAGKRTGRDCTMLDGATGALPLSATTCPDWILPNDAGLGYYRMLPKGKLLDQLLARAPKVLTLAERVGLIDDVQALVASGDVGGGAALALAAPLARDKSRHLVDASLGLVGGIDEMVPDDLRPRYERFIRAHYVARARELGWTSKPGEDDDTRQLRPSILALVANRGEDAELIAQATALTWKWLDDRAAIEPELVGVALGIAATHGDQKLFDRLHADAKAATDRADRQRLLGALASFADPAIAVQAFAITLTDEFELRDALGLLQGGFGDRRTRASAYGFVKDHFDEVAAKLPEGFRAYLAFSLVALCDESRKAEVEAFFGPRVSKFEGGPRAMTQALESLSLCAAGRKAQAPAVRAFLEKN